jgi:hypothetical protein
VGTVPPGTVSSFPLSRHGIVTNSREPWPYARRVREIDLAVYADALAGETAALAARAERLRSNLRQAKIERRARNDLPAGTVERLQGLGLLCGVDERRAHAELRELDESLAAVEQLQAWVEEELAATNAA